MIVVAIPVCDRKASSQMIGLPYAAKINEDIRLYINVETQYEPEEFRKTYAPMIEFLENECTVPWEMDVWRLSSTWRMRPSFDQDQTRLAPIVIARNMAIDYALNMPASHLLFIDADVIVHRDGAKTLMEHNRHIVCGLVPGRGPCSEGIYYIFGPKRGISPLPDRPYIHECDFSTCGYMLLTRELISVQRFRWGGSRENPGEGMSEDPAYCEDAYLAGFGRVWVDTRVRAEHWDDPERPLTAENYCRDVPYSAPERKVYWR